MACRSSGDRMGWKPPPDACPCISHILADSLVCLQRWQVVPQPILELMCQIVPQQILELMGRGWCQGHACKPSHHQRDTFQRRHPTWPWFEWIVVKSGHRCYFHTSSAISGSDACANTASQRRRNRWWSTMRIVEAANQRDGITTSVQCRAVGLGCQTGFVVWYQ